MTTVLVQEAAAAQAAPEIGGGLPYWLFWFLLCVILLLVATIFLRDKDLRRRLSGFLSGTRRRMLSLRLQAKLRRGHEKKAALWRELGRRAWSEDVTAASVAAECRMLAGLEEEMHARRMAWHEVYSRIEALGREHEQEAGRIRAAVKEQEDLRRPLEEERRSLGARKSEILDAIGGAAWEVDAAGAQLKALEREARTAEGNAKLSDIERAERLNRIKEKADALAGRVRALEEKLPVLHEERRDLEQLQAEAEERAEVFVRRIARLEEERTASDRAHERELQEWLRRKQDIQDGIVRLERQMEPRFENMGRALDEARVDNDELAAVYFEIDAVNRAMADIEARLERLR
jgi:chromosome segregation ATPase